MAPPAVQRSRAPRAGIEHVIVLMLENRSFDHMLGYVDHPSPDFPRIRDEDPPRCPVTPGYPETQPTTPDAAPSLAADPSHSHAEVMRQVFGTLSPEPGSVPSMDGFIASYQNALLKRGFDLASATAVMKCFADDSDRVLSRLAKQYAVCTRWFASVPGETWPNRNYAHAATSAGEANINKRLFDDDTIFNQLSRADVDAAIFHDGIPQAIVFSKLWWPPRRRDVLRSMDRLFAALDPVDPEPLPSYSFIEPNHGLVPGFHPGNSQHPSHDEKGPGTSFLGGERLLAAVHNALLANPGLFATTLLVVTYDEHGGFYDREPPRKVAAPDDRVFSNPDGPDFHFTMTGVRVPAVLVSPRIPPGTVLGHGYDHASIPKSVREQFAGHLPALTERDRHARDFIADLPWLAEPHLEGRAAAFDLAPSADPMSGPRVLSDLEASLLHMASAVRNALNLRWVDQVPESPPFIPGGELARVAEQGVVDEEPLASAELQQLLDDLH